VGVQAARERDFWVATHHRGYNIAPHWQRCGTGRSVARDYYYNARLTATMNRTVPLAFTLDLADGRQYAHNGTTAQRHNAQRKKSIGVTPCHL
jgi:hypothetical protein